MKLKRKWITTLIIILIVIMNINILRNAIQINKIQQKIMIENGK